ncbi:CRISPR-associated helicase/endonuclease Cas3 [Sulfobacillus thermosulfidooxidans]|uniref:CRISPR-associated helicase/endonuclease Cas3 n=1 Tax=Sulfobacillus thermosulfidooxidans TaxID=28034 RepID=UPI0006B43A4F|nr:CRISPR-associated helicase/endonuclease Cas3 [Sulfobacillus thermosulfidooxidans]
MWQFDQCIARPGSESNQFPLSQHLWTVGEQASAHEKGIRRDLLKLAGLLHDMGKARNSWQQYIRKLGPGVHHAFLGAALFFYLVQQEALSREDMRYALFLCRDIACHHGVLDDLSNDPPWFGGWEEGALREMDLKGFHQFIHEACPRFSHFSTDAAQLEQDLRKLPRIWRKWSLKALSRMDEISSALPWTLRGPTSALIAADRFDAANIQPDPGINADLAKGALAHLEQYIEAEKERVSALGGGKMAQFRQQVQHDVEHLLHKESTPITILQMPTGSGKTLVAIRAALKHFVAHEPGKLIYVAPYLSIVTQTAGNIRHATHLEVLEQHHLSLPDLKETESPEGPLLLMESWQSPVVVTTFNQLFGAIFPRKAQESMRLRALHHAYVIIDEPQIMDSSVWNMFLTMLRPLTEEMQTQILIMSATIPPYRYAFGLESMITVVSSEPLPSSAGRFVISVDPDPKNVDDTAQWAQEHVAKSGSCAVILNTIADVAQVTERIQNQKDPTLKLFALHGAMQPLHKAYQLSQIKNAMKNHQPTLVIATQTLEAGIDISFQSILRARAILPSIIQAAGRANRHGENSRAHVKVFDYIREDGSSSRHFVYRDAIMREETDALLTGDKMIEEPDIPSLLNRYFDQVFERNHYTVGRQRLIDAACGQWSAVAGLEPFGQDTFILRIPVFIPLGGPKDQPYLWIDDATQTLMQRFDVSVEEIYERFIEPGFLRRLDFLRRKQFLNLLGRFMINIPLKQELGLTEGNPSLGVQRLVDIESYSADLGLGHWYIRHAQDEGVIL